MGGESSFEVEIWFSQSSTQLQDDFCSGIDSWVLQDLILDFNSLYNIYARLVY